jgi:hypothetical protein
VITQRRTYADNRRKNQRSHEPRQNIPGKPDHSQSEAKKTGEYREIVLPQSLIDIHGKLVSGVVRRERRCATFGPRITRRWHVAVPITLEELIVSPTTLVEIITRGRVGLER